MYELLIRLYYELDYKKYNIEDLKEINTNIEMLLALNDKRVNETNNINFKSNYLLTYSII